MWKLGGKGWFIYYREKRWRVGDRSDNGHLRSEETAVGEIPETSWEYWSAWSTWNSGAGITVKRANGLTSTTTALSTSTESASSDIEPQLGNWYCIRMFINLCHNLYSGPTHYPANMTISQIGSTTYVEFALGQYSRINGKTPEDLPVWKQTNSNQYLYFKAGRWRVHTNTNSRLGWMRSPETQPETIPETGWEYKHDGKWRSTRVTVKGSLVN